MPFYQFGDNIFLGKIPTALWVDYIVQHFEDRNRHISREMAQRLTETVENYSSYVQQLAWLLFSRVNEAETATEEQLRLSIADLLNTNEPLFMQQIEPLSAYQLHFLRAIVNDVHTAFGEQKVREEYQLGSPSNITRLKTVMLSKDLVESRGRGMLYLTDPVFGLWLQHRII